MEESWNIKGVNTYRDFFRKVIMDIESYDKSIELISNLCYGFQHIEFLTQTLQKELHEVIKRQTIKTYLIVGSSIIESILNYYLISTGNSKKNHWEEIDSTSSNIYIKEGKTLKNKTIVLSKLKIPTEKELRFSDMINIIESKKILNNNEDLYRSLKDLKTLRNKVHLKNIESNRDHDWNNFNSKEYDLIRDSLRYILKSEIFNANKEELKLIFGFLLTPMPKR